MTGNRALLTNFVEKFLGTVRFGNNDLAVIAGYGDVIICSMKIKKVYYVKGLGHNLFSVGQFCDKGLEIAFRKSTCFVRNEDGVDLLTGDRSLNLYTIAINEVASNSSTCLLANASSSQSCCGINRYVLVVVDDYSLYTWVFFLQSKDEASEVIISFIKKTQVNLQLQVQRVRTDNGTEFKNKTLAKFFDEDVGKLKAKGDIGVFVGYSKESVAFRIYNKRTLSKFDEASKNDLEDLFQDFYDEYFDSSKIMKSSTTNVETLINEEAFHEVFKSFQGESSSSSLNDDVQQSLEE
nr:integrase, catalytic region, zinc finger, CCHC-type, peptidase aspartic, catalytic [Tanacetum cinerariifolium]